MTQIVESRFTGRSLSAIIGLVIAMGTLTSFAVSVSAQVSGSLTLVSQTPYVPAEGGFQLVFDWSGPVTEELTFGGTIFAPITTETEVHEAPADPFAAIPTVPLSSVPRDGDGNFVYTLPLRSVADGDPTRTLILEPGVFPVTVEIRNGSGDTLAGLRTNMIRLPGEAAEIELIPVAVVLEVSSAEGLTVEGTTDLLNQHPLLPLAIQLGDGVITQLENSPESAAAFRDALGDRSVTTAAEPNLDPSALAGIARGDLYLDALQQTSARLADLGLNIANDTVPLDSNLTTEGVDLLRGLGGTIVIDTGARNRPTGLIRGGEGSVALIQIDEDLTAGLRGPVRAVERAHRLLATLAIRSQTDRSPIVLGGSLRGVPLAAIDTVLTALDAPGFLSNTSLNTVADLITLPVRADEQPSQNLEPAAEPIATFTATMATYEAFFVTGQRPPAVFDARLLEALSPDLNPDDRLRAIAPLQESLEAELSGIDLPDGQSVTLAARRAEIPLTVNNESDGIRTVSPAFESEKIRVDQDHTTVQLPPGVSTIDIDLESLSLGQSPLLIKILTPDETAELATTQFGVRSTAIPGLGLLLSATALVFLLAWWIVSWSRDRAQRSHPSSQTHEAEPESVDS